MRRNKTPIDYAPKKLSDTEWEIHHSFVRHWLIRGDIIANKTGYLRVVDDAFLPEHKKGHTYIVRK